MDLDEEELKATRILNGVASADEMFEELGYIKLKSFNLISYNKEFIDKYKGFNKYKKTFKCMYTITFDTYNKTFYKGSNCRNNAITIQELKAINKKCKELGWI